MCVVYCTVCYGIQKIVSKNFVTDNFALCISRLTAASHQKIYIVYINIYTINVFVPFVTMGLVVLQGPLQPLLSSLGQARYLLALPAMKYFIVASMKYCFYNA